MFKLSFFAAHLSFCEFGRALAHRPDLFRMSSPKTPPRALVPDVDNKFVHAYNPICLNNVCECVCVKVTHITYFVLYGRLVLCMHSGGSCGSVVLCVCAAILVLTNV